MKDRWTVVVVLEGDSDWKEVLDATETGRPLPPNLKFVACSYSREATQ